MTRSTAARSEPEARTRARRAAPPLALALAAAAFAALAALSGCKDDDDPSNVSSDFSTFVSDLIANGTSDTTDPVDINNRDFQGLESADESAFDELLEP
jgi:hypothetical protein